MTGMYVFLQQKGILYILCATWATENSKRETKEEDSCRSFSSSSHSALLALVILPTAFLRVIIFIGR